MRSVSIELRFKINQHRTTRCEFLIGDGLLKFCVAFVHLGVKCGGVKFLPGHCKLIDEREMKITEAFDGGIASCFGKSRGAATRYKHCGHIEENISSNRR